MAMGYCKQCGGCTVEGREKCAECLASLSQFKGVLAGNPCQRCGALISNHRTRCYNCSTRKQFRSPALQTPKQL